MSNREEEYKKAREIAIKVFLSSNIAERCRIAGAKWYPDELGGRIHLPFFNTICEIILSPSRISFKEKETGKELSLNIQILALHYLNGVKDIPPSHQYISFRQVPSGEFYYPAFQRRSTEPLLRVFGRNPEGLKAVIEKINGCAIDLGDVGAEVFVFPKVSIRLVLWLGEGEFPPELQILFDATIIEFLSTEDIAVLSQEVMIRMIKCFSIITA
ncbi:MAG: DUF3786 domain-containing protein [Desulfobacterota bacterium]|nr:DUF3786 domain-containing protein [Thermodesulfobacteriota bacterium]